MKKAKILSPVGFAPPGRRLIPCTSHYPPRILLSIDRKISGQSNLWVDNVIGLGEGEVRWLVNKCENSANLTTDLRTFSMSSEFKKITYWKIKETWSEPFSIRGPPATWSDALFIRSTRQLLVKAFRVIFITSIVCQQSALYTLAYGVLLFWSPSDYTISLNGCKFLYPITERKWELYLCI